MTWTTGCAAVPSRCMASYSKFDADSEHDCGVFIFAGFAFEWRIEYRGKDGTGVSPDPADPEQTFRVLTLVCHRRRIGIGLGAPFGTGSIRVRSPSRR